jgi:hypothetical protein
VGVVAGKQGKPISLLQGKQNRIIRQKTVLPAERRRSRHENRRDVENPDFHYELGASQVRPLCSLVRFAERFDSTKGLPWSDTH